MKWLLGLALVMAAFWALTLWKAARHERLAEAEFPPSGQFLTVNGHRVHYTEMGQGRPLVLIHGLSGNIRDMTFSLMPRLAERYRVIAFDRPGMGYTPPMDGATITEQANLLADAAAALGAERPIVMGHSYGGAVALAWAVHRPDDLSALVLEASPAYPWEGAMPLLYRVNSGPLAALAVPLITAWVPDRVVDQAIADTFAPQDEVPGYAEHIGAALSLRRTALRANAQHRAGLLDQIRALVPHYPDIPVPIELIHGTADTTVGLSIHAEPFSRDVPQANLTRLDGIGHMIHNTRPGAVIEAIHRAALRSRM